ncbi:MAG: glycosyltransferase family 2 protein [Bacteroidales bacterium]|jgi:hypothetical protein
MEEVETVDLSIVIVSYNVKDYLIKCLDSIYKYISNSINFEIIVVDNNSKDTSPDIIEEKFNKTILIKNNYNAGFPAANNQAFKIAKGNFILMLNPDTELFDDSVNKLFLYIKSNTDISIIGPKILNTDGSLQQSMWRFPTIKHIFAESFYLKNLIKDKYYKDINQIIDVNSLSGAVLMFRKELFNIIGMLDENLFWIEDVDFCYRTRQSNHRVVYYPEAQILHHIGQSAKKNYNVSIYNQIFNKINFFKKHNSTFQYFIVWVISFIHVFYKIILFFLIALFKNIYYKKAKAYLFTFKFFLRIIYRFV